MIQPAARPETLVGRLEEIDFLQRFVQQTAVNGGALLLSGEAGVGKTALLEATADAARDSGTTVLRVTGAEFEAEVSFASLNQALFPLVDEFSELGDEHAQALRVALGFEVGPPPDRLLLSNAVTLLFRRMAARAPLLLVIDDLPWLDRASAAVLSFVARRLIGSRAGLLAAFRSGSYVYFDVSGLPEMVLQALDDEAAAHLLAERFPGIDPQVRARVLSTAQGNPLALLELPQALRESRRGPAQPLPRILPLTQRLQGLFAARVAALPAATRTLLLTAALESTGDLRVLQDATDAGYRLDDLAPAEQDQLVRVEAASHKVTFRHPLIRSAVVAESTSAERRQIHQALAQASRGNLELRAWHLGEATVEPDEEVAALLQAAARRVRGRGDYQAVISLLCRAADLSPMAEARSSRLAEAAYIGAEGLAEAKSTTELLQGIHRSDEQAPTSLHYASAAALQLLDADGHVDTAHRLLVGAIESWPNHTDADDEELITGLWTLALVCIVGGRAELWEAFHTAMARLRPEPPEIMTLGIGLFGADPVRTGVPLLPTLEARLATIHRESDPAVVQDVAASAIYPDRLAEVREPLWRSIRQGRAGGPGRRRIVALMDVCFDDFVRGEWAEAGELADEGLAVCDEFGGRFFGFYFRYHQALLAAVQGRFETSRALADQMIGWAGPRGVGMAQTYARHALVLAHLGEGNFESAYQHATGISPAGTLASHVPHSLWVAMELVEAAVRTDRRAEAERHVRVLQESGIAALSPRLAMRETASAALVAGDEAPELFERALSLPRVAEWPFDAARVRLLYGERLRRSRAANEARVQLKQALGAFEKLGAAPWAARAERELRAAGQATRTPSSAQGVAALTSQELEIARLAASGMTNKEIGERLFISPRTVSSHLYQIFPKLGITKRAALRDAIGGDDT
ncbi:helix-turn-helix transcriptional regulator [Streptomyces brasiliensis]|uniref:LuxR family transcriptional regulator n=1 Tax=Streptomyces brasiliensis TaxID=1954 RepID=A0A917NU99_9ACTN|nr:LuxR family transcriptional regulator [Streptomyces brasiliensis]GGJ28784.1 LuxR family transcriptional regulator [Streptomyces brasiliensis]